MLNSLPHLPVKISLPHTKGQAAVIAFDGHSEDFPAIGTFEIRQITGFGNSVIVLQFFQVRRFQDSAEVTAQDASFAQFQIGKHLMSAFATGDIIDFVITAEAFSFFNFLAHYL
jgi:hypothetical protein